MGKSNAKKDQERGEALRQDIDFVEHTWPLDQLYSHFTTSLEKGLTEQQVEVNRGKYGANALTPPKTLPWWMKFLLQFANFFAGLLILGGGLCFISYAIDQSDPANLYLGIVLIAVVTITAIFSHFQESKSEALMEGFKNMIPRQCNVIRNGKIVTIEASDLVPGDMVRLEDGMQVPADLRLIQAVDIKVDNSSLTGESEPIERSPELMKDAAGNLITQPLEANNLCFYTTIVQSGQGVGCVIGTGDRTVMGQIAGLTTTTEAEQSPIRKEINKFILFISVVAISLGIIFLIMGLALGAFKPIENIVFCIGIIVANVPEGLLATVTVSLALTAKRMHQKNVLVKNLEAVETLGSTTVIASDKTGTLTQNRMTVQHAWYDGQIHRCPAPRNLPQLAAALKAGFKDEIICDIQSEGFKKLQMVATCCNNSQFILKDPFDDTAPPIELATDMQRPDFNLLALNTTGDASESGLTKFMQTLRDVEEYRAAMPKLFEIKFNSTNKWQLSIHKPEAGSGITNPVLVLKGAPERVLKMCKFISVNGQELEFDAAWEAKYTDAYETLGGMGERVLGFAYKNMDFPMDYAFTSKPQPNFPLDDLVFAGLFSLIDPPSEGVPEAVAKCKRARIKVFRVPGHHPITAQAIAKQVGIIDQDKWDSGNATVVKGDDIRDWMELEGGARDAKFDEALSHEQIVWARVSPAHKLLIVENAQRRGEVVAVTGDGVNDAPALKKGDIGVAMGIAGKDVSKEAADMILLDDNFASIVNGVEEGRLIFDNLKKSISYTLTSNIPEIAPFLCFIILQLPLPLSTVLILCVDLGTDMVPAISLAHELKEADIMDRPPRNAATDRLVNRRLITFAYLQIGVVQACAGFFSYMVVLQDYGYTPDILMFTGVQWEKRAIMCSLDDNLRPSDCGYGCGDPEEKVDGADTLFGARAEDDQWCTEGCMIPPLGSADPFVEHTAWGFRGYSEMPSSFTLSDGSSVTFPADRAYLTDKYENTCGRTCAWYNAIPTAQKEALVAYNNASDLSDPLQYVLTEADVSLFDTYCALDSAADYGFPNRGRFSSKAQNAQATAFYWWNGERQVFPNKFYQVEALKYAQSSYFITIVVVQWSDLIISKTRKLSVFEQGMKNKMMNFGLVFETVLAICLSYIPFLQVGLGTRPIHILHWFTGFPWSMLIFGYDEVRKSIMRANPGGWLDHMTYW